MASGYPAWFGERDYQKRFNSAIVECAQGGIRSILDYVRRGKAQQF